MQAIFLKQAISIDKTFFDQVVYASMDGDMGFPVLRAITKMLHSGEVGFVIIGFQQEKRQQDIFLVKLVVGTVSVVD